MTNLTRRAVLAGAVSVLAFRVHAASYPERSIRMSVAFPAGSTPDIIIRLLEPSMSETLGRKLIIEPRVGASGNLSMKAVVDAEPDGYTFVVAGTSNFVVNQFLFKDIGFDPLADLRPVAKLADVPLVYVTNKQSPANSLQDFVVLAKEQPGKLNYATPSAGTLPHLTIERLKKDVGIDIVHVPFGAAPPAVVALLANDVQLFLIGLQVVGKHIESGDLKPLAVTTAARMPQLPDVPTTTELGLGDVIGNWWALSAPAGVPDDVVDTVRWAVAKAFEVPSVRDYYAKAGMGIPDIDNAMFMEQMRSEADGWKEFLKDPAIATEFKKK